MNSKITDLKTEKEALPYKQWKDKLNIQRPDTGILKMGSSFLTTQQVLDMYDEYCNSF